MRLRTLPFVPLLVAVLLTSTTSSCATTRWTEALERTVEEPLHWNALDLVWFLGLFLTGPFDVVTFPIQLWRGDPPYDAQEEHRGSEEDGEEEPASADGP
jgi:hypothetical protein